MGFKFKRLAPAFRKVSKATGRAVGAYAPIVAPLAGGLIGGPVGAVIGGGAGAGLARLGANESKVYKARLMQTGVATVASAATFGLLNVVAGGSFLGSPITNLFGAPGVVPGTLTGAETGAVVGIEGSAAGLGGGGGAAGLKAIAGVGSLTGSAGTVVQSGGVIAGLTQKDINNADRGGAIDEIPRTPGLGDLGNLFGILFGGNESPGGRTDQGGEIIPPGGHGTPGERYEQGPGGIGIGSPVGNAPENGGKPFNPLLIAAGLAVAWFAFN